jgi:glycosyltransferase involved in cell wall biosynthesis
LRFLPPVPHREMARLFGSARIAIGLATTDGTPNTMLEAMIAGAFPIQSDTISTREWIDGHNGLLVPPEDAGALAEAILLALEDDALVDCAAELNAAVADARLERGKIREQVIQMYRRVMAEGTGETSRRPAETAV